MDYVPIIEGSGTKIGTMLVDTDKHMERFIYTMPFVVFQNVLDSSTQFDKSIQFYIKDYEYIYINVLFENTTDTATFRLFLYDVNNICCMTEEYTSSNTGIDDGASHYYGITTKVYTAGFTKGQIILTNAPSATVHIAFGGCENATISASMDGYSIGGYSGDDIPDTDKYTVSSDSWEKKSDCPSGSSEMCGGALANKIYAFGGDTNPTENREYSPDVWAVKTNIPSDVNDGCSFTLGNYIYAVHSDGSGYQYVPDTYASMQNAGDTQTNTQGFVLTATSERGYRVYGDTAHIRYYVYDTWTLLSDMPTSTRYNGGGAVNNVGYLLGGTTAPTDMYYVDTSDTYTKGTDMPSPGKTAGGSFVINDVIYFVYGDDGDTSNLLITTVTYTPNTDSYTNVGAPPSPGRDYCTVGAAL